MRKAALTRACFYLCNNNNNDNDNNKSEDYNQDCSVLNYIPLLYVFLHEQFLQCFSFRFEVFYSVFCLYQLGSDC